MKISQKLLPQYKYDDYKHWEGDWELINGIPFAMAPSPLSIHQYAVTQLIIQIGQQLERCPHKCYIFSVLDWIIQEDTVVRPDLVVICSKVEDYIKITPEVIFEVVPKQTALKDEKIKKELYESEGVPYYVLIYPEFKKVRIFKIKDGKYSKVADCVNESFEFEMKCRFTVDFKKVWLR
ncbi:MAG: Uma2 family endonuclease [Thermodesulfovibrionales bacterium]|nr:Uma2 family endonuclease [Thermodesulfovibrionales bacterium]